VILYPINLIALQIKTGPWMSNSALSILNGASFA
jgi:hypothetical protein